MEDSIRKRLSLQKEVLNWLNQFSEHLQIRSNAVTLQVHQLLDRTDIVEQDMKNTLNSFRNLTYSRFLQNKISEEDELSDLRNEEEEDTNKRRGQVSIPAQSYETNILPRYKEAVSLGLSSYHNHIHKTNTTPSVFKSGLGCNPLPHLIDFKL